MRIRKLGTACLVTILVAAGCSRMSETSPITEADTVTESADAALPFAPPAVEVAASTRPQSSAEQRPIMLPKYVPEFVNASESMTLQPFEIGTDTTEVESPVGATAPSRQQFSYASGPTRYAPSYPERPVPTQGMTMNEVLAAAGEPANRMDGVGSEVWDYGTYRVFFKQQQVAFTRVW